MLDIVSTKQNTKNQLLSEALDFEEESNLHPHPDFWLFTHISEESVDVYLHRRYEPIHSVVKKIQAFLYIS